MWISSCASKCMKHHRIGCCQHGWWSQAPIAQSRLHIIPTASLPCPINASRPHAQPNIARHWTVSALTCCHHWQWPQKARAGQPACHRPLVCSPLSQLGCPQMCAVRVRRPQSWTSPHQTALQLPPATAFPALGLALQKWTWEAATSKAAESNLPSAELIVASLGQTNHEKLHQLACRK